MVNKKVLEEKDQKELEELLPEDPDIQIVKENEEETQILDDLTNIDNHDNSADPKPSTKSTKPK